MSAADPDFVYDLIAKLKFEVYLQQDEIIREGTVGNNMFFINSGTVQVFITQNMARIIVYLQVTTKSHMKPRYLSEGEHFGEICLFVSNLKRTASIVATTSVSVYTLNAEDFNETLKWYPRFESSIRRLVRTLGPATFSDTWSFGHLVLLLFEHLVLWNTLVLHGWGHRLKGLEHGTLGYYQLIYKLPFINHFKVLISFFK